MIKRIVGFGCSWIHGDEIEHPTAEPGSREHRVYQEKNCTFGQLAKNIGIKYDSARVVNRGISGGSLQSTQWEFSKWMNSNNPGPETLVVVGLTEASRQSWWNGPNKNNAKYGGRYMHNHWIHPGHLWEDFVKFYYANSDEHKLWSMNYWTTVTFIHNYCTVHNVPLFMFNVFPAPCDMPEVTNSSWNARGYMHSIQNSEGDVLAPGKHPNEKGSKILADKLASLINIDD